MVSMQCHLRVSKVKHIQLSIQLKIRSLGRHICHASGQLKHDQVLSNEWGESWNLKNYSLNLRLITYTNQQQNLEWTAPWMLFLMFIESWIDSLQFCIAKCDFLFVWHFSCEIWHKVMSHDPALLSKTEMLLLYPNVMPWPITNSPAYCELFQNSLTWIFYNLFTFIFASVPTFLECCSCQNSKFVYIYKYIYVGQWKLWKSFLVLCQLNKSRREFYFELNRTTIAQMLCLLLCLLSV